MRSEDEIRERYIKIMEELREADTKEDKLFMYGRLSLLEWVLQEQTNENTKKY